MKFKRGDKLIPNGVMKQNACIKLCDIAEVIVDEADENITFRGIAKLKRRTWYLSGYNVNDEVQDNQIHYFNSRAFTSLREKESYNIY